MYITLHVGIAVLSHPAELSLFAISVCISSYISAAFAKKTLSQVLNACAVLVCAKAVSLTGQYQADLTIVKVSHALFVTLTISLFVTGLFSKLESASYLFISNKYG